MKNTTIANRRLLYVECPKCGSHKGTDQKSAYRGMMTVFSFITLAFLVFFMPIGIFLLAVSIFLAIAMKPKNRYMCLNCKNRWDDEFIHNDGYNLSNSITYINDPYNTVHYELTIRATPAKNGGYFYYESIGDNPFTRIGKESYLTIIKNCEHDAKEIRRDENGFIIYMKT